MLLLYSYNNIYTKDNVCLSFTLFNIKNTLRSFLNANQSDFSALKKRGIMKLLSVLCTLKKGVTQIKKKKNFDKKTTERLPEKNLRQQFL